MEYVDRKDTSQAIADGGTTVEEWVVLFFAEMCCTMLRMAIEMESQGIHRPTSLLFELFSQMPTILRCEASRLFSFHFSPM
jgi:hypothetical protein